MAALPWFRLYHETATDPKVQMLSEANQRRYIMLLCLRCCNGDVTLQDNEVAFQLRITEEQYVETKAVLIERDLIDETNSPKAWDKRQLNSDSSAARVAAHRARKKQKSNVTGNDRETKTNAVDTDTDTDTEVNNNKPAVEKINYRHHLIDVYNFDPVRTGTVGGEQFRQWGDDGVTIAELDIAVKACLASYRNKGNKDDPSIAYIAMAVAGNRAVAKPTPAGKNTRDYENKDYSGSASASKFKKVGEA